ncbi:N-lysine methyltransferase SMYD2-like isoform X2 [Bombus pyrosoma]|uniref:N-lysine methyltransferase SMYD2-like isoform X1 n=1 Tax=Bombus pyrosoma TaxID=396416 RepID=UPI001CB968A2|nr:N-lysine methyltransferase SMYD2-like isoform X1 [Bombus pyrosoma]XP_043592234.1 N-lysine methyltransferase SMYD2-like isoform X2 [Bombus pyrosoma]
MDSYEEEFAFSLHFDETESDEDRLKKYIDHLLEKPLIIKDTRSTNNAVMFISMARTAISYEDYEAAVNFYTKGLQEVVPYCELSAILYSNRAEALGCLEMYKESLIDIDRAIEISPNTELTKRLKDTKMELEKKASRPHTKPNNRNHFEDIPSLSHDENKDVPGMSDAVRLVHSKKYGVNFEATKPIGTGDVILIEKPQATSIFKSDIAVANVCYYCLERCIALLPCEQCNSALYCSKECRAKAYEEYHRIQCNSKNLPDDVQFVINLLMKITKNGEKLTEAIKYCEKLDTMSADSIKEFYTKRDNLKNNLKSVLSLSISMKKNDKRNAKYIFKSAHIALFLRNQTNYMQGYNDILSVAKLLFRLFYIYHVHVFMEDISIDRYSSGVYNLYSLLSLFHHSCCANTVHSIHKNGVIVVRATKDMKPGEQITFNFLRTSKFTDFVSECILRQVGLREEKHILCNCVACERNYDFNPELGRKLKIPRELERRLRKKRFDIDSLWELLKVINNERSRPCLEAELLKAALPNIYLGKRETLLDILYRLIGIS